jgi:cyclin-dependent kinase 8/11
MFGSSRPTADASTRAREESIAPANTSSVPAAAPATAVPISGPAEGNPSGAGGVAPEIPGTAQPASAVAVAVVIPGGGTGAGTPPRAQVLRIAEKYAPIGKIGEGTYGLVYKARYADGPRNSAGGGDLVAVKKFKSFKSMDGISPTAIREIKLLRELRNRYIVDLVDVMLDEQDKALYLVFDYAEHDLLEMIRWHHSRNNAQPMPMQTVKSLLYQILMGINYLHMNWIIHRDLKPSNILVTGLDKLPNERGCVKIADFGLARLFQSPLRPLSDVDAVVVTIWYRAPELLLGAKHYTKAIDLWAIGCIFAELITSKPLFQGVEKERKGDDRNPFQADQVDKIFRVLGKPKIENWPGITELPNWGEAQNWQDYPNVLGTKIPALPEGSAGFDLLSRLLEYNPASRITASQALQHEFFKVAFCNVSF